MTVNELIEQLKNYPSDMRVLTWGYEGGLNDISLKKESVVFNTNTTDAWYMGQHDYARFEHDAIGTDCIVIGRTL